MSSQRKKGALLSYVFMTLEILSGMLFTPFLIRSFGQSEYGVYSLVASITSYLYLFDLGIGNSIIRYMSKYRITNEKNKQCALMGVTLLFYVFMSVLIIAVGIFLYNNFGIIFNKGLDSSEIVRAKIMLSITVINAVVTLISGPFSKTIIAFEKFTFSKSSDIIKIVLRVSISLIILKLGGKGVAIVTVNLCMTILFTIVSIIYTAINLKVYPRLGKLEKGFVKNIFSYSIIVFIQMVATQLNSMVDQLLMGIMVTASSAIIGVYAIGAQISTYLQSIASSINGVLMPGVVRMVEATRDTKVVQSEMIKIGRLLFMMLSLIYAVFVIFGDDFIVLWAGENNAEAYYVSVIIMFPMVFQLSQSIGGQILWAMNRHKVQATIQILIALGNVILTAFMIKWNPIIGASIATAITYFVGNVVIYNIIFSKYIGISIKEYYIGMFKGIIPCLLVCIVVGVIMQFIQLTGWIGFCINCIVMIVPYCVLMYYKGMNEYEKNMFKSISKKIVQIIRRKRHV